MNGQEKRFMEGVWEKVREKEKEEKLAEAMLRKISGPSARGRAVSAGNMGNLLRGIVFRQVCEGMADVLFISFVIAVTVLYLLIRCVAELGISADIAVFGAAPILYACIFLLFWARDAQSGIYGLQMSYRYTFFHVLAARMLAASLLGMCFNGVYVLVFFLRYEADALRLMAVSFSSLTVFSVLLMAGIVRGRHVRWAVAVCAGWAAVNAAALSCWPQGYGEALRRIPAGLLLGAGAAALCVYLRQLLYMTTLKFRKEYSDAAN